MGAEAMTHEDAVAGFLQVMGTSMELVQAAIGRAVQVQFQPLELSLKLPANILIASVGGPVRVSFNDIADHLVGRFPTGDGHMTISIREGR